MPVRMAIAIEALSWPSRTKISPVPNAPPMAVSPAVASTASSRSRTPTALATSRIAVPISAIPRIAWAVSASGAVAISVMIPACASDAGTST